MCQKLTTSLDRLLSQSTSDRSSSTTVNSLYEILQVIKSHLEMETAFIAEFSSGKRIFRHVDCDNNNIIEGQSDPSDQTYCKKICDGELDTLIRDTRQNAITRTMPVTDKLNIGCYIGYPIKLENNEIYGTLCCFKRQTDPTLRKRDADFVSAFADLAGRIITARQKKFHAQKDQRERIENILERKQLHMVYQPIFDLGCNQVIGFEALARFATSLQQSPDLWFKEAHQIGYGEILELEAIKAALTPLNALPDPVYISVNASPALITKYSSAFMQLLSVNHHRIIVEITEHASIPNYQAFHRYLAPLRDQGLLLAVDDTGAGYSSLNHILEIAPDLIKLDLKLIRDIHKSTRKQVLVMALVTFAKAIGTKLVAEGVETSDELDVLKKIGVDKIQGYFISKPLTLDKAIDFALQHSEAQTVSHYQ